MEETKKEKINKFINKWSPFEKCYYLISITILISTTLIFKGDILMLIMALCGITGSTLLNKVVRIAFIFYVIQAIIYVFISFTNKFYGEVIMNLCYSIPFYSIAFFRWNKNKDKDKESNENIKNLNIKLGLILLSITVIVTIGYGFLLKYLGTNQPFLNSLGTCLCMSAVYLATNKYKSQWLFWLAYSLLLIFMWINNMVQGGDISQFPILILNVIFIGLNIIGYISWNKQQRKQNVGENK